VYRYIRETFGDRELVRLYPYQEHTRLNRYRRPSRTTAPLARSYSRFMKRCASIVCFSTNVGGMLVFTDILAAGFVQLRSPTSDAVIEFSDMDKPGVQHGVFVAKDTLMCMDQVGMSKHSPPNSLDHDVTIYIQTGTRAHSRTPKSSCKVN
jgi:hypothetical protein